MFKGSLSDLNCLSKKEQEERLESLRNSISLNEINKIQDVLKSLDYEITGFIKKDFSPIVLYLKKIS